MILQSLKEYYDRKAADPDSDIAPEGWERKEIPFLIVINEDGDFVQFEDTREGEGKKKRGKVFLVPQGVKRTSGIAANLLWDTPTYVLGVDAKGNAKRAQQQKAAFALRIADTLSHVAQAAPIVAFFRKEQMDAISSDPLWPEIEATTGNLTFRVLGDQEILCQRSAIATVVNAANQSTETSKQAFCLLTGEPADIAALHVAIKGVNGAQSVGGSLVSFNLGAFNSFGKKQGFNAPIGESAMFAYTTGLNTLLHRDSGQRMSVGDATTVFWSQKKTNFEKTFPAFFSEPPTDNPDEGTNAVRALFSAVDSGSYGDDDRDTAFYVLGLAPNAARLSIRFWQTGTIAEFATKIRQHFEDIAIVKPPKEPEFYSLWRLLVNIAPQNKTENIPPNIAGDVMRAILNGMPYPASMLQAALRRIQSDVAFRVNPVRAALLKGYLNRYHRVYPSPQHKEVQMTLDTSQPSIGYQLGRLFATLEKIQEEANPGLNATIRERFYGAACSSPVTVFGNLIRLKNHHITKMDNKGRATNFEKLLAEIMGRIDDFPAHLNLNEQGRFAIGYYHQRQDFFTPKKDNRDAELA